MTDQQTAALDELYKSTDSVSSVEEHEPADWRIAELSAAQRRVLNMLLEGLSVKEVALRLNLSRHTIHSHVSTIYSVLQVGSRAALLVKCLHRNGGI